ncbi:methyl-accepting chemotaxis protein [Pseudomonas ovata]
MTVQRQEAEQVAAAINQMSTAALQVAASARSASGAALETDQQSRYARQVVDDSHTRIQALTASLSEAGGSLHSLQNDVAAIVTVLDVIRSIADQTNLLALNAAIEAARAGDAGRGFAVVADEVRALASHTQRSTQQIQATLETLERTTASVVGSMQQSSDAGQGASTQAAQAGQALGTIVGLIGTINEMNAHIAGAAQEQTAVAHEINHSVHQIADAIDSVAEQTRTGVQTSEALHTIGHRLQQLLGQFRI